MPVRRANGILGVAQALLPLLYEQVIQLLPELHVLERPQLLGAHGFNFRIQVFVCLHSKKGHRLLP